MKIKVRINTEKNESRIKKRQNDINKTKNRECVLNRIWTSLVIMTTIAMETDTMILDTMKTVTQSLSLQRVYIDRIGFYI